MNLVAKEYVASQPADDRWAAMMKVLERNDITAWREKFVRALSAAGAMHRLAPQNFF
jgi:trehalose-6-phosphate synthase